MVCRWAVGPKVTFTAIGVVGIHGEKSISIIPYGDSYYGPNIASIEIGGCEFDRKLASLHGPGVLDLLGLPSY